MNLINFVNSQFSGTTTEEKEVLNAVGELCQIFVDDNDKINELVITARDQYKNKNYNAVEKTLDSLLGIFGMTTVPSDAGKIPMNRNYDQNLISSRLTKVDDKVRTIINERDASVNELAFARKEIERLSIELNSANEKLSKLIIESKESEKRFYSHVQRLITAEGQSAVLADDSSLAVLLSDYGLEYTWDNNQFSNCFTVYKISDETAAGVVMPALIKNGKTLLNGIVYELSSSEDNHKE